MKKFIFPIVALILALGLALPMATLTVPTAHASPAFPTVAAVNGGNNTTAGTSHTVNLPAGITSGNLLIAFFACYCDGGNYTITFPGGWNSLFDTLYSTRVRLAGYYRIADGTEGATITVTTSGATRTAHTSYRITGYSGTPECGTSATGYSTTPDPPSLTPSWGALDTLWLAVQANRINSTVTAYPANYTDGRNDYANHADGCGVGTARRERNASSEDPGTFTISATRIWIANTIAIKPVVVSAPTVTTSAATNVEETTATGNGTITATGGATVTRRGFCYKVGTAGDPTTADSVAYDDGSYGTGAYTKGLTSLTPGTGYRVRAYAVNSAGTGYGTTVQILTKPAAPTNVQASDGAYTDKVVITWTKSTGATGYQVYRNGTALGWLGDVATYDDTGATAPTITPGAAAASDGLYVDYVALSLSGQSANNGTTHTYKVRARNATGESVDSGPDPGYRGVGALTYQWQRSAADSDADYSNISGATTASYNDTGAPADGSGRYYRCVENATGAAQQISAFDRGYRLVVSIDITAPADIVGWNLTPLATQPLDQTGTLTVTCNGSSWTVTATDEDTTSTNGQMTKYDGASYDTGTKLATAMKVKADNGTNATGSEVTLPTGGIILTGTGAVTNESYTIRFRQTVLWTDPVVTDPDCYRIVVTFTGSTP